MPLPSGFTLIFDSGSSTRLAVTRIFTRCSLVDRSASYCLATGEACASTYDTLTQRGEERQPETLVPLLLLRHLLDECVLCRPHLLWCQVLDVLCKGPFVAPLVLHFPHPISPEHVRQGHRHLASSTGRSLERGVDRVQVQPQARGTS